MLARRALIAGGIAVAAAGAVSGGYGLVEAGVLPGKYKLDRMLGACGTDPGLPGGPAGPVITRTFRSAYRRRMVRLITMLPPGTRPGARLPVTIALHGAAGDAESAVSLGYPRFLAASVRSGRMAIVSVDGGGSTYWHRRADGDDPLGMIEHELLPRLGHRVGLTGWSMGGYGALLLAERLGPSRVAAVAVSSPAVFGSFAAARAANAQSFDSAADFTANDVLRPAGLAVLRTLPTMIDCGSDDPFGPQASALRQRLGQPPGAISGGCHDNAFWRRQIPAQLAFLSSHLTARSSRA